MMSQWTSSLRSAAAAARARLLGSAEGERLVPGRVELLHRVDPARADRDADIGMSALEDVREQDAPRHRPIVSPGIVDQLHHHVPAEPGYVDRTPHHHARRIGQTRGEDAQTSVLRPVIGVARSADEKLLLDITGPVKIHDLLDPLDRHLRIGVRSDRNRADRRWNRRPATRGLSSGFGRNEYQTQDAEKAADALNQRIPHFVLLRQNRRLKCDLA